MLARAVLRYLSKQTGPASQAPASNRTASKGAERAVGAAARLHRARHWLPANAAQGVQLLACALAKRPHLLPCPAGPATSPSP
eukprot:247898-Pyramimonas_sp.AAC.1